MILKLLEGAGNNLPMLLGTKKENELIDRLLFILNNPLQRDQLIKQGLKQSQLFS
jgi:hypothetical protein